MPKHSPLIEAACPTSNLLLISRSMPSNKNQHFVPRCYLGAFSGDTAGAAINLFNIDRSCAIRNAPLKGQCSKSYFYGEDLHLEKALQTFEGAYAAMLREIVQPGYHLTAAHGQELKEFWCLQHLRTEASARRSVVAAERMIDDIGLRDDTYRLTMRESVEASVSMLPIISQGISDLKACLVKNVTNLPFVTSDDPAISANRWHQQDIRAKGVAPGLGSAGALLFLPMTPNILALLYDSNVYSIRRLHGWASIDSISDIAAFNEHQYLNAFANIYFHDWHTKNVVEQEFLNLASNRPADRHRFHYAVWDRIEDGAEVFREVSAAEAREHERSIVHQEAIYPVPTRWPRLICFRTDGHVWFNGSGAGYTRQATIPPTSNDYKKYPSRRGRL